MFDPILVVSQIVAMQCIFYGSLGLWLIIANLIAGLRHSVDQFFDYHVSFYAERSVVYSSPARSYLLQSHIPVGLEAVVFNSNDGLCQEYDSSSGLLVLKI